MHLPPSPQILRPAAAAASNGNGNGAAPAPAASNAAEARAWIEAWRAKQGKASSGAAQLAGAGGLKGDSK